MTTQCPVASFIREKISISGKAVEEIAQQAGFGSTRQFVAVTEEEMQLPWEKIAPLSKALGVESGTLLKLCVSTYVPELWKAIEPLQESALTKDELRMIRAWRSYIGAPYIACLSEKSQELLDTFLRSLQANSTIH